MNVNIVYIVLVNEDYIVNYDLLKLYLFVFLINDFFIMKEMFEVFEYIVENLSLVKEIDVV